MKCCQPPSNDEVFDTSQNSYNSFPKLYTIELRWTAEMFESDVAVKGQICGHGMARAVWHMSRYNF